MNERAKRIIQYMFKHDEELTAEQAYSKLVNDYGERWTEKKQVKKYLEDNYHYRNGIVKSYSLFKGTKIVCRKCGCKLRLKRVGTTNERGRFIDIVKKYICDKCGCEYTFMKKEGVRKINNGDEKMKCSSCGGTLKFIRYGSVNTGLIFGQSTKVYKCLHCGRETQFRRKESPKRKKVEYDYDYDSYDGVGIED